jgi:hypothetical protein
MAAIDNAAYRVFVREQIRPLCEAARALSARVAAMKTTYDAEINNVGGAFANGANGDTIVENRTSEGVNDLTKLQIAQAIGALDAIRVLNAEIISIPCVRALEAS